MTAWKVDYRVIHVVHVTVNVIPTNKPSIEDNDSTGFLKQNVFCTIVTFNALVCIVLVQCFALVISGSY